MPRKRAEISAKAVIAKEKDEKSERVCAAKKHLRQHRSRDYRLFPALWVHMQTAEGIIAFLESELNEAMASHDKAKENKDMEESLTLLIKAHTISGLLEKIKES